MSAGTQARADRRALLSAAFLGSSIGLGLGATFLIAGLGGAISDHVRAVRIAQENRGALAETMLQRKMERMDAAALMVARAHDALAASDPGFAPAQAWPGRFGARFPTGRHASALDGKRDLECMTEAVYFEARGETPRGQAAVAQVVLNRMRNPNFPKSVCGVVFQGAAHPGCQFSFVCDGSRHHRLDGEAWTRARRIAERALAGVAAPEIGRATHFHTIDVQPYWGPTMLRVAQVGLHVFYRLNPHAPALAPAGVEQAVFTGAPAPVQPTLRLMAAVSPEVAPPAGGPARPAEPSRPAEPAAKDAGAATPAQAADSAAS